MARLSPQKRAACCKGSRLRVRTRGDQPRPHRSKWGSAAQQISPARAALGFRAPRTSGPPERRASERASVPPAPRAPPVLPPAPPRPRPRRVPPAALPRLRRPVPRRPGPRPRRPPARPPAHLAQRRPRLPRSRALRAPRAPRGRRRPSSQGPARPDPEPPWQGAPGPACLRVPLPGRRWPRSGTSSSSARWSRRWAATRSGGECACVLEAARST